MRLNDRYIDRKIRFSKNELPFHTHIQLFHMHVQSKARQGVSTLLGQCEISTGLNL